MVKFCLRMPGVLAFVLFVAATAHSAEILVNGSFEQPDLSVSGFQEFANGDFFPGWNVGGNSIDLYNDTGPFSLGAAFDGHQYVDLDGAAPGQLTQTFATNAGTQYQFFFAYANNYQVAPLPKTAQLRIFDTNSTVDLFAPIPFAHDTSSAATLDWFTLSGTFFAIDSTTTIDFTSLDLPNSVSGILLDAVSIEAIPETSTVVSGILVCGALIGYAVRRRCQARA